MQPDAEQSLAAAAHRLAQREQQAQRAYHARVTRPTYWAWLEQGGLHGTAPIPRPVKQYVQRYGPNSLEDLAP